MLSDVKQVAEGEERDPMPFIEQYYQAWETAGQPDVHDVTEIFLAALHKVIPSKVTTAALSHARLHPLFVFMCTEIRNDVNLSWFKKFCPVAPIFAKRAPASFGFPGSGSPFASMIQKLMTQPDVEVRAIQVHSGMGTGMDAQQIAVEEQEEDRLAELAADMYRAYINAGCPERDVAEDTMMSAIGQDAAPPHATAYFFWEFVRQHRDEAQVKWLLGHLAPLEGIRRDPTCWQNFLEDESAEAGG